MECILDNCFKKKLLILLACFLPTAQGSQGAELVDTSVNPKHIIYVGSEYYPPLESISDGEPPKGFITDLQNAMAYSAGATIEVKLMNWDSALRSVQDGSADAIALIPSKDRSQYFDFTEPFYYVAHGLFTHSGNNEPLTLTDMRGKKVAIVNGAYAETALESSDYDLELVVTDTELECLKSVANEEVHACIEVIVTSKKLADNYGLDIKLSSSPFWPRPYAFGVKKGNTKLQEELQDQLAKIVVDGTYSEIYQKWESQLEWKPQSFWKSLSQLSWLMAGLVVILSIVFFINNLLRRKVNHKTAQLERELKSSRELHKKFAFNATHDSTTKLLNRKALFDLLDDKITYTFINHTQLFVIAIRITNIVSIISVFGYRKAIDIVDRKSVV